MDNELWREIPNFPGYEVSDQGRVRSWKRNRKSNPLVLIPQFNDPYVYVHLRANGKGWTRAIHRLVAITFLGPTPKGMETCHNNGNPLDNRLCNLRYDTHNNNMMDAVNSGKMIRKITPDQALDIRERWKSGETMGKLAAMYNVTSYSISEICHGKVKSNGFDPGELSKRQKFYARARLIREDYATGKYSMKKLGQKYGVSHSTIGLIVLNKNCFDPDYVILKRTIIRKGVKRNAPQTIKDR